MGGVFLGMPGPWADDNREASDHYTAKIGGLPDWPSPLIDWGSDFLKCSICGNKLCLVGQVPAPITSGNLKVEDRVLYIFGCIAPKCGSRPLSWRAIRIQRSCEEKESNSTCCDMGMAATPSVSAEENNWWNDLDENEEDVDLEELGRALAEAATVTSNSKKLNRQEKSKEVAKLSLSRPISRQVDDSIPVMPCFYIYTLEEPYLKDATSTCLNYSSLSINVDNHVREEVLDEESYEYDRALMADRTYFKFKKRLDAYPEQCLRCLSLLSETWLMRAKFKLLFLSSILTIYVLYKASQNRRLLELLGSWILQTNYISSFLDSYCLGRFGIGDG